MCLQAKFVPSHAVIKIAVLFTSVLLHDSNSSKPEILNFYLHNGTFTAGNFSPNHTLNSFCISWSLFICFLSYFLNFCQGLLINASILRISVFSIPLLANFEFTAGNILIFANLLILCFQLRILAFSFTPG